MEWTAIKKDWTKLRPKFHDKWNKLTEADLSAIAGNKTELVQRLETKYHIDHKKAEKEADEFVKALR